jgi:hypothetical protein
MLYISSLSVPLQAVLHRDPDSLCLLLCWLPEGVWIPSSSIVTFSILLLAPVGFHCSRNSIFANLNLNNIPLKSFFHWNRENIFSCPQGSKVHSSEKSTRKHANVSDLSTFFLIETERLWRKISFVVSL